MQSVPFTTDVMSSNLDQSQAFSGYSGFPVANCNGLNLTSVPQNLSVNIVGLDLSQNNIHEIVNDSFAKYRNLVTLNLNKNKIKEIQENGFSGLGNLKELYISENNVNISSDTEILRNRCQV
jgi:Leucine-rich repeat (LRR) protein